MGIVRKPTRLIDHTPLDVVVKCEISIKDFACSEDFEGSVDAAREWVAEQILERGIEAFTENFTSECKVDNVDVKVAGQTRKVRVLSFDEDDNDDIWITSKK